jgi:hypothetical protein
MALARCPASRIAVLWLALLGGYWGLVIYSHRDHAEIHHIASSPGRDSLVAMTFVLTREMHRWAPSQREAFLRRLEYDQHLRDSILQALRPPPRLSKAQLDSLQVMFAPGVNPLVAGLAQFHGEVSGAFTRLVLFFLVPLIGLVTVTAIWFVLRRPEGPRSPPRCCLTR